MTHPATLNLPDSPREVFHNRLVSVNFLLEFKPAKNEVQG
jgi:hypothetical protein